MSMLNLIHFLSAAGQKASKPDQKVMLLAVMGPFQIVPHPFILLI
jgi:hypothetical protein